MRACPQNKRQTLGLHWRVLQFMAAIYTLHAWSQHTYGLCG